MSFGSGDKSQRMTKRANSANGGPSLGRIEERGTRSWVSKRIMILLFAVLSGLYLFDRVLLSKLYIFEPSTLQHISQKNIEMYNNDTESMFRGIVSDLRAEYGEAIIEYNPDNWFISNAGGAMGFMTILHASISEYLIFFGTPLGTEGHTGVHMADDYFTILQGEQRAAIPGQLYPRVYKSGSQHHLSRGIGGQYIMPAGQPCWALELAQGWIPAMLPFGLFDSVLSTLDYYTIYRTFNLTARAMFRSIAQGKF